MENNGQIQTDRFFKCLKCGHVTKVSKDPPKCERCNTGSGVISEISSQVPSATSSETITKRT